CQRLIELALREDFGQLGIVGDVTSRALLPADLQGRGVLVARARGMLAGLPAAALVAAAVDPLVQFQDQSQEGAVLQAGDHLAILTGPMRSLLAIERTALNFLQHLSGIATLTHRYVDAIAGLPSQILDTRKTTP